ncbi:MAG TPA: hypothetical protein VFJ95_16175 [Gammaproteobacteria bacterium]|jgi:ABC-type antimicrobial peptide transport system permease subunit|nr:hypothetical protein [Gammaproteobacteria bacterium]
MDTLRRDVAYALRALRSRPLVTAVIVLTLALGASVYLAKLLGGMLHGVESLDAAGLAVTAAVLAGATLLAAWIPARRATRVDPLVALKEE